MAGTSIHAACPLHRHRLQSADSVFSHLDAPVQHGLDRAPQALRRCILSLKDPSSGTHIAIPVLQGTSLANVPVQETLRARIHLKSLRPSFSPQKSLDTHNLHLLRLLWVCDSENTSVSHEYRVGPHPCETQVRTLFRDSEPPFLSLLLHSAISHRPCYLFSSAHFSTSRLLLETRNVRANLRHHHRRQSVTSSLSLPRLPPPCPPPHTHTGGTTDLARLGSASSSFSRSPPLKMLVIAPRHPAMHAACQPARHLHHLRLPGQQHNPVPRRAAK
ncbi:hypothetical protein L226DRAFT_151984 [Lentinus tigrinus ALCF2SS1-7]|uniref:uncharacterized protein n=1 Tax=Lentinus tigrinus ALCF2SS1-7 TaxID=1328758 RepID=UPI001166126B|nr:hypothetical protein L226DRAFT_151984 [Lentinus tigrinus ALCF2SS1-7]